MLGNVNAKFYLDVIPYGESVLPMCIAFGGICYTPAVLDGSLVQDVEEGVTGMVFRSEDPTHLAETLEEYYQELYLRPTYA